MTHSSPRQIFINDGAILQISLRVTINYELISVILSHGDEVKVEEPLRLKEIVREKARNIANQKLDYLYEQTNYYSQLLSIQT